MGGPDQGPSRRTRKGAPIRVPGLRLRAVLISPTPQAYNYVTKNFGDCTPHVIGALRLLARCYTVDELNDRGYGFYVSRASLALISR